MSDDKKVWVSFLDTSEVTKKMSVTPGFAEFNYAEYLVALQKCRKDESLECQLKIVKDFHDFADNFSKEYGASKKLSTFPDRLWLTKKSAMPKKYYLFGTICNYKVVNEVCANILKQFNLGETTLTPVKVYDVKTQELVNENTYYFLNIAEHRQFVSKFQHVKKSPIQYRDTRINYDWYYHVSPRSP